MLAEILQMRSNELICHRRLELNQIDVRMQAAVSLYQISHGLPEHGRLGMGGSMKLREVGGVG